jgi:peroxiredoxin Q/BCP
MFAWFSDPIAPGTPAPDFCLLDQDGSEVTLAKLRGKNVVLIFYPADETPTCRAQLCEFRDSWSAVQSSNTLVFGINPQNAESHREFRERRKFPFPLLVDKKQEVGKLYRTSGLIVRRTVYLIGPDGVIRYSKRGKPSVQEVLGAIGFRAFP